MKTIVKWRRLLKYWSVQLKIAAAALLTFITLVPEFVVTLWAQLPDGVKEAIPPKYAPLLSVVMIALSIVAQNIKQKKLRDENEN